MEEKYTRVNSRVHKIKDSAFYDPSRFDFASAISNKDDFASTFIKSGLLDIATIVQKELYNLNLLDSLYIELNILATILDDKSPRKLSYIRENVDSHESFANNVKKYGNAINTALYKRYGYTIFDHPDIFFNQNEPEVSYSIIDSHANSKALLSFSNDYEDESTFFNLGNIEMNSDSEQWVGGPANIVVGNSRLGKDYKGIVKTAKELEEKDISVQDAMHEFHRYYHNYFAPNRRTVYMAIPILGAYAGNHTYLTTKEKIQGQGVVFIFFSIPTSYPKERIKINNALDNLSERLFNRIGSLVRLLTYNYLFNIGANLADNANKKAISSAVSAIMSRNMSHNLGSHYLYYTKNYLMDLAGRSGEKGADIRGAAKVLGYIQARMDYIATVISNDRYPNGAVNFKSQIYDELTVDDFSKRHFSKYAERGKRTTNFLLTNLVKSENFTRPDIFTREPSLKTEIIGKHFKPIRLQVKLWNGSEYQLFTGESDNESLSRENDVKNELSKLNIALPGGSMSCHAFFNVLENFIRNSAKYLQSDFKEEGLIFTIAIKRNVLDPGKFDFIIYDNKNNADKVLPVVKEQLQNLRILDEYGGIEKSSKGLKEMLFSSVWMRTYKYPLQTFAEIITEIHNTRDNSEKLQLIEKYGFQFISISDSGEITDAKSPRGNLGLLMTLSEFNIATDFVLDKNDEEKENIIKALEVSSDIVCFGKDVKRGHKVQSYFTRSFFEADFNEEDYTNFIEMARVVIPNDHTARLVYRFKKILDKRFSEETGGDIDNVCLMLGDRKDMKRMPKDHKLIIYFERHLSTKKGLNAFVDYAYADSVSGGNYTITLNSLINEGITADTCRYKTWNDKLYGLKIKESALTRITLIDERLFNSMKRDGSSKELEYSLKNIRILSMNLEKKPSKMTSLKDLLEGNMFQDGSNRTHFLSIHLGLIEKVTKSEWGKKYGEGMTIEDRVTAFMEEMRMIFGGKDGNVFISVHSGRGNYSKELDGPLATYPFISLAAIENAFSNSKYLLTQLFYNTIYIGKGIIHRYL